MMQATPVMQVTPSYGKSMFYRSLTVKRSPIPHYDDDACEDMEKVYQH